MLTPGDGSGDTRDVEQALADLSQTHSDVDQTASDADATSSASDSAGSLADQLSADADQRASDADQASSDLQFGSAGTRTTAEQTLYADARDERRDSTHRRSAAELARTHAELERVRSDAQRFEAAQSRDSVAAERDRTSETRDAVARRADAALLVSDPGNHPLREVIVANGDRRDRAREDRRRAAADRQRAAEDRMHAAVSQHQARIDVQRAQLDGLTGIYARELGRVTLRTAIDRCRRRAEPLVLVLLCVDGLAEWRDRAGPVEADALMESVVRVLRHKLRSYDPVVRISDNEFLCALPARRDGEARRRVDQIRDAVRDSEPSGTLRAGFATLHDDDTLSTLVARAITDLAGAG